MGNRHVSLIIVFHTEAGVLGYYIILYFIYLFILYLCGSLKYELHFHDMEPRVEYRFTTH